MTLTVTADPDALDHFRDAWRTLADRAADATLYQTWEWNHAWWQAFHRGRRLRLLLIHDGSDLVGIGPFYIRRHLGTPLRRLAFLGTGSSDYLNVIAAPGHEEAVYDEIHRYLVTAGGYDLADLQQVPEDSGFAKFLSDAPQGGSNGSPNSRRVLLRPMEECPCVPLIGNWEEYLRGLGKRMRANIGYYTRLAMRELPDVSFELCGDEDVPAAMDALFKLHQRRWRSRMLPGVLGSPAVQRFHRDVAARMQRMGLLRLHILRSAGAIIAVLYCFKYRSTYYYYLGGFDPSLGRYSPGTILTAAAIRRAMEEGCSEFDFLRGKEAYKQKWRPAERRNLQCLIAGASGWRSDVMFALNRMERYVEIRAKAFSDRGKGERS